MLSLKQSIVGGKSSSSDSQFVNQSDFSEHQAWTVFGLSSFNCSWLPASPFTAVNRRQYGQLITEMAKNHGRRAHGKHAIILKLRQ